MTEPQHKNSPKNVAYGPLSMNGPKNNDKKMKWPVEAISLLLRQDALHEEKGEANLMRFSSIRL